MAYWFVEETLGLRTTKTKPTTALSSATTPNVLTYYLQPFSVANGNTSLKFIMILFKRIKSNKYFIK